MLKLTIALLFIATAISCPDDPYCRRCEDNGKCSMCEDSTLDAATGKCIPVANKIPQCVSYSNAAGTMCQLCDYGFATVYGESCMACKRKNCASCNLGDTCTACYGSVMPIGGKCDETAVPCNIENCDICTSVGQCRRCLPTFSVLAGTNKCIKSVSNCEIATSADKCKLCNEGYYIDGSYKCVNTGRRGGLHWFIWFLIIAAAVGAIIYVGYWYYYRKRSGEPRLIVRDDYAGLNN